jgi:hypothetical protein
MELIQELGDEAPPLEEAVQVRGGRGQTLVKPQSTQPATNNLATCPQTPASAAGGPPSSSPCLSPRTAASHPLAPPPKPPWPHPPKVRPFNLRTDATRAIRDLDPINLDTLVAVRGMVTRTGTIIPDLRVADFRCELCHGEMSARVRSGGGRRGVEGCWAGRLGAGRGRRALAEACGQAARARARARAWVLPPPCLSPRPARRPPSSPPPKVEDGAVTEPTKCAHCARNYTLRMLPNRSQYINRQVRCGEGLGFRALTAVDHV